LKLKSDYSTGVLTSGQEVIPTSRNSQGPNKRPERSEHATSLLTVVVSSD